MTNNQSPTQFSTTTTLPSLSAAEQLVILNSARIAVYSYAGKYIGRHGKAPHFTLEEINDIIGDTIYKACRSIRHYNPEKAKLSTWVSRIALNCVIDAINNKMKRLSISYPLTVENPEGGEELNESELCDKKKGFNTDMAELFSESEADRDICSDEFENLVEIEIGKLSERDQKIAHMVADGYSNSEMAEMDGGSINAVTKRVCVVRKTLKGPLSQLAARFDIHFAKLAS